MSHRVGVLSLALVLAGVLVNAQVLPVSAAVPSVLLGLDTPTGGASIGSPSAATLTIIDDDAVDTTPPTVSAPNADFRTDVRIGKSSTPVRITVTFAAVDASGIIAAQLQHKGAAGVWMNVPLSPPNATTANTSVGTSNTARHKFRARATDGAEAPNTSAYVKSPAFKVRVFQDGNGSIVQRGTWTNQRNSKFFGGSVRYSSSTAASQKLTLRATDFAVVSTTGPDRGKVRIFVDGALRATVDGYAPATSSRQVIFSISFGSAGVHQVELRPTGTMNPASSGKRVDFDAFLVMAP